MRKAVLLGTAMIFVVLCPTYFTVTPPSRSESYMIEDGLPKPKENIYAVIDISYNPAYGYTLRKTVVFEFEDVEGLPIETNISAFGDGFIDATIVLASYGAKEDAIRVVVEYDLSVGNETANEYASLISDEVMKAINKTGLPTYWRNTYINDTIRVVIDRGLVPETLRSHKGLLEYRPKDGFGELITEDLLSKSMPGEVIGLQGEWWVEGLELFILRYTLERLNNTLRWCFMIGFEINPAPQTDTSQVWFETLDINELLLREGPIKPSAQKVSQIIVQFPKRCWTPKGIYEMSLESIRPVGILEDYEWRWVIPYNITAPIDNVVATVKISKLEEGFKWDKSASIALIVTALVIMVALLIKKRKGGEKGK